MLLRGESLKDSLAGIARSISCFQSRSVRRALAGLLGWYWFTLLMAARSWASMFCILVTGLAASTLFEEDVFEEDVFE